MSEDIQKVATGAALNAEHYQTFEMAKANDDVIGGDNIAQIRSYAAYARAQAQAIHKTIAATSGIDDVAAIKAEATETSQTFAKVSIYADQRIGEILRELPKAKGNQYTSADSTVVEKALTKAEALKDAGISTPTAYQLEQLAANPEVVQAILDKAEEDGRIPSRKQVLDAINAKKRAESERDSAVREMQEAYLASESMELEVESLKEQLRHQPKPEVVTKEVVREVTPDDYESLKTSERRLRDDVRLYSDENQKLRSQLEAAHREVDAAKSALGTEERVSEIRRDVRYLINATDGYVKQYGGLTWTFEQLSTIDKRTLGELKMAVKNLATFSSALMNHLEEVNGAE